jgi:hypothetical protein
MTVLHSYVVLRQRQQRGSTENMMHDGACAYSRSVVQYGRTRGGERERVHISVTLTGDRGTRQKL